ncbi:MAG: MFS transporter [Clostridiales bacterium]|nr:MFS transporter [Clostridiales bacterium]
MKRLKIKPLEDERMGWCLCAVCFLYYTLLNSGRLNYSAALSEISTSGFMEKDAGGLVNTAFFIVYGCGQLVNGFISDKVSPFRMITLGFAGAGVMNIAMFTAFRCGAPFWVYLLIWAVNGYCQSSVWPTMIRIVSNLMPERLRTSAGTLMLASTATGTMLAYLLSSLTMHAAGWQTCFIVPGVILLTAAVVWLPLTAGFRRKTVSYVEYSQNSTSEFVGCAENMQKNSRTNAIFPLMIASGAMFMIVPILSFGIVKDGITVWTPTIITETFSTSPELSTLLTTIIPLTSLFGSALAKVIIDKWLHDEMKSAVLLFALSVTCVGAMFLFGEQNLVLMLVLMALSITFLLGVHTMFISLVPLNFGKYGRSATVTGILNAFAAVGGGISTYIVGLLAKDFGWSAVYATFIILLVIGLISSAMITNKWIKFKNNN